MWDGIDKLKLLFSSLDKKIQNNKKCRVFLVASLMLLVFVGYSLYSLQFHSPAILSDEGGYLTKALAFSGVKVDAASSWQGGYPILISPIFRLFSDPNIEWRLVLEANAIMWTISAVLLFYVLRRFFPKKSNLTVALAVAVSLAFPGCISMTALAYATSAFVMVLMMALAALIKSKFELNWYLIIFALLAGYLFWIHPTGIVFILAVILYFIARGILYGNFKKYLLPIAIMLAVSFFYFMVMLPWFNYIMTPVGATIRNHYDDFAIRFLLRFTHSWYWIDVLGVFMGQISYLLISSFGIVGLGAYWLFYGAGKGIKQRFKNIMSDMPRSILAIIILSIIGASIMVAIYFPADIIPLSQDQWIYGRYVEMYILPLIGVGLLADWKLRPILWSAGIVLFNGILLSFIVNSSNTILYSYVPGKLDTGLVFIFWPAVFSGIIPSLALGACYLVLFTISCLGILFVGYAISKNKKGLLILLLLISLLALRDQVVEHTDSENTYSGYSGFVELIMKNYRKGSCVGFSDKLTDYELSRLNYIKFYLHEYSVERINSTEWLNKCDGPYLTYDVKFVDGINNVKIIAKDRLSGLYVIMRNKNVSSINLSRKLDYSEYTMSNRHGCKVDGCLDWNASSNDPSLTKVGEYQNGTLHTTGREGYLFIGPKVAVDEGAYRIKMKLHISKPDTISKLKITSDNGNIINRLVVFHNTSDNPEYIFQLGKAVDDLQIMLYVGKDADMTLSSYQGTEISELDLNN
jgi:hypothetical protein